MRRGRAQSALATPMVLPEGDTAVNWYANPRPTKMAHQTAVAPTKLRPVLRTVTGIRLQLGE